MTSALLSLLLATGPTVNVRVEGDGYLRFLRDGVVVYAREAKLTVRDGYLASEVGPVVVPRIAVAASDFSVSLDGTVTTGGKSVGRLVLSIASASGMKVVEGFFTSSEKPQLVLPGEGEAGVIVVDKPKIVADTPPVKPVIPETKPEPKPEQKPETRPETKPETKPVTPAVTTGKVVIDLKPNVEISGDQVTLGDIAQITGPEDQVEALKAIEVDRTPPLGVERRIDVSRLPGLLRSRGIDPKTWESKGVRVCVVSRTGQLIPGQTFVDEGMKALKAILPSEAVLAVAGTSTDLKAPLGQLTLRVTTAFIQDNRGTATVEVLVNNQRYNSRTLTFSITGMLPPPRMGATVKVITRSGGIRIETTGRVVGVNGASVEIETPDRVRLTGRQTQSGVIEVNL